jgi:hypothetical protein
VQTNLPRKAELARHVSRYFTTIFKSKMLISKPEILFHL